MSAPPQSAIVVAFEDVYDLSLLANTLSDQGIDSTLIVPSSTADDLYESLIDVEVLQIEVDISKSAYPESRAIQACSSLFKDEEVWKRLRDIRPTFVIFPALRHDGCLIPLAKHIDAIPVIWTRSPEEEIYVFEYTGAALPVQSGGFFWRLSTSFFSKSILSVSKNEYVAYALRIVGKDIPHLGIDADNLYSDVRLILWGADTVLRSDFASLTQFLVEVGCHHCRGPHPLQTELQELLVEYRLGTIVATLDETYSDILTDLAKKLPQGREGQAILWKSKYQKKTDVPSPENLFIRSGVDRQDIIGYRRARVLLSHCGDTELLEAAFHGTPVICFPRSVHESKNAIRAVGLGFGRSTDEPGQLSSKKLLDLVGEVHEKLEYRENARKASLAIRDRINPASDRLIYWLGYMARRRDEGIDVLRATNPARTLNEDLQFLLGLLVGSIVGAACAVGCLLVRQAILSDGGQRSKGRYER